MIRQILGAISFFVGLLIVIGFPFIRDYQPEALGRAGILIGIILIGIGIYLMR
jgi:hypothetical protein